MIKLFEHPMHREVEEPIPFCWKVLVTVVIVFVLLIMVIAFCSCSDDRTDEIIDDGNVMITLRLSLPGSDKNAGANVETRAISATIESQLDVTQLKVLVFKLNGSTETFAYEAPQIVANGVNTYTVILRKSMQGENYRLVIIANAGTKLPFIPEGTVKSDALKMITFSCSGAWNANSDTDYTPIPMWGETNNAKVINETTTLDVITLLRALARIDVGCVLSGETATGLSNFTLKSVTVYRVSNKGYVAPLAASLNTNGSVGVKDVSLPGGATVLNIPYSVGDGKSLIRTIYVAETAAGTTKDNAVCLIIGGTYAGNTNYYRVDFTSSGSYVPIKRNCRYVVSITQVSAAGYANEAEALKGDKFLQISSGIAVYENLTATPATTGATITL